MEVVGLYPARRSPTKHHTDRQTDTCIEYLEVAPQHDARVWSPPYIQTPASSIWNSHHNTMHVYGLRYIQTTLSCMSVTMRIPPVIMRCHYLWSEGTSLIRGNVHNVSCTSVTNQSPSLSPMNTFLRERLESFEEYRVARRVSVRRVQSHRRQHS